MEEFKLPPYSSLIGSTPVNFYKIINQQQVDSKQYKKLILSQFIVWASFPFHLWEEIYFKDAVAHTEIREAPLFILGHWRSGTTLLHNLLCHTTEASYVTTYQSVFPNNLASKFIYKVAMKKNLPGKRPGDNVKLNVDYPQEDEFALSNTIPYTFYNFFYFPKNYKSYYNDFVRFNSGNAEIEKSWKANYRKLLIKAMINTGNKRLIVKNPVNTARVKTLLDMFPDARFIHIHRHPVEVYLSTKKFFTELFPTIWLHKVDNGFIENMIFDLYRMMYQDYFSQKENIPKGNLYEVSYHKLLSNIQGEIEMMAASLGLSFNREKMNSYLANIKGYRKNEYNIGEKEYKKVLLNWADIAGRLGYPLYEKVELLR